MTIGINFGDVQLERVKEARNIQCGTWFIGRFDGQVESSLWFQTIHGTANPTTGEIKRGGVMSDYQKVDIDIKLSKGISDDD